MNLANVLIAFLNWLSLVQCDRLGLQSGLQESVDSLSEFLQPEEFFSSYVIPGKPVLFKGVAKQFPAYEKWTDVYLNSFKESSYYLAEVELGKKENREDGSRTLTLSEFIDIYKTDDIYWVDEVPKFLANDFPIPRPLNCPEVIELIQANVMWFSSGNTKSVWHNDSYENLNCLLRGQKEFIMASRVEGNEKVHIDVLDGSYSTVNVEDVDESLYPGFRDTTFYNVTMESGDCLYIPWLWYHTVSSTGSNLAVNIWWRTYRTPPVCESVTSKTLSDIEFRDEGDDFTDAPLWESVHQAVYSHPVLITGTTIGVTHFVDTVSEILDEYEIDHVTEDNLNDLFNLLDHDQNEILNYREIDSILQVLPKFLVQWKDEL